MVLLALLPQIFDKIVFLDDSWFGTEGPYYVWTILTACICGIGILTRLRNPAWKRPGSSRLIALLIIFCCVSVMAALFGFYQGNEAFYVLGDLVKFLTFAMVIAYFIMVAPNREELYAVFAWILLFYFLTLVKDLLLYITVLDATKLQRPFSMYLLPAIIVLVIGGWKGIKRWPVAKFCGVGSIFLLPFLVRFADSLALVGSLAIIAMFFVFFSWLRHSGFRVLLRYGVYASVGLIIALGVVDAAGLMDINPFNGVEGDASVGDVANLDLGEGYTAGKLAALSKGTSLLDIAALLGGGRILFIFAVIAQIQSGWGPILFGTGMGGNVQLPTWELSAFLQYIQQDDQQHFIEMAYPELFVRAGMIGLTSFLAIFGYIIWLGLKQYRRPAVPLIVPAILAIISYLMISFVVYADFPKIGVQSPWFLALLVAFLLAELRVSKNSASSVIAA